MVIYMVNMLTYIVNMVLFYSYAAVHRVSWDTYFLLRIKSNTEKAFWAKRQTDDLQDRAGHKGPEGWCQGLGLVILCYVVVS